MSDGVVDALSVDVEDWHNATVLQCSGHIVPPTDAVRRNTEQMLALLEEHGIKATWFFLGEVAETFPQLVQMVVKAGHEVGVHGYHHHQIHHITSEEYRESIFCAKDTVEQAGGVEVIGYRAVDFGINRNTWYAFDVLVEAGFIYDSSIFPFAGPRYGMPDAPPEPHWIEANNGGYIYEIPLSVTTILGIRIPCCGGGYFRRLPLFLTRIWMRRIHNEGRPVVFYLHPCEIEFPSPLTLIPPQLKPEQIVELRKCHKSEVHNRQHTGKKLRQLFNDFRFGTMRSVFGVDRLELPSRD